MKFFYILTNSVEALKDLPYGIYKFLDEKKNPQYAIVQTQFPQDWPASSEYPIAMQYDEARARALSAHLNANFPECTFHVEAREARVWFARDEFKKSARAAVTHEQALPNSQRGSRRLYRCSNSCRRAH